MNKETKDRLKVILKEIVCQIFVIGNEASETHAGIIKMLAERYQKEETLPTKEDLRLMRDVWLIRLDEHSELRELVESLPPILEDIMRHYVRIGITAWLQVRETGEVMLWRDFTSAKGNDEGKAAHKWKVEDPAMLEALREVARPD